MVGNDAVMHLAGAVGIGAGRMSTGLDQAAHQVGVVIVVLALQECTDPLQPHAGIDRRLRQAGARAIGKLLELHEDQVPDFDEPVAILFGAAGRAAPDRVAMVVEDFGAGAAGAGRAHHPEVVICGDADDPVIRQARHLFPDLRSLIIGMIDGDQQLVFRDAEVLGQQVPGERNGLFLEIIAKAEIAQHLEKRVVPRRVADIVQVIVLAARAHAFLRSRGAAVVTGFDPGEQVLELHHAGIGEHQCRIVAGHQGAGLDHAVAIAPVEIKKGRADIIQRRHGGFAPLRHRKKRIRVPFIRRIRACPPFPARKGKGRAYARPRPVLCRQYGDLFVDDCVAL